MAQSEIPAGWEGILEDGETALRAAKTAREGEALAAEGGAPEA